MKELEGNVRTIEMDGLVWGASKLVAVGFGIKKLQINLVIEDDKVSLDDLQQRIESDEEHVQSTDVVSCGFAPPAGGHSCLTRRNRLPCKSCRREPQRHARKAIPSGPPSDDHGTDAET